MRLAAERGCNDVAWWREESESNGLEVRVKILWVNDLFIYY